MLGSVCGLRNPKQIHNWASNQRVKKFLHEHFKIAFIPSYFWLLSLLKLLKPESLNKCFINWAKSLIPNTLEGLTASFDGKTIRSTGKMDSYKEAFHIVSAYVAELGITIGQKPVDEKSNEIPAMRELIELLELSGCMVVADALHCQRKTAKAIVDAGTDYLLNVKDNQEFLKKDIEDYVQDSDLRSTMDTSETLEKSRDRLERRTAFVTNNVNWLPNKEEWESLSAIGAINRRFTTKEGSSDEWHYYISSRQLSADELLKYARNEWSVETMHWLLDVHFDEDFCHIEDPNIQENLNMVRKIALNIVNSFKRNSQNNATVSKIMLDCLIDCEYILTVLPSM